eukprot:847127-Prymnesium_polylepis.1
MSSPPNAPPAQDDHFAAAIKRFHLPHLQYSPALGRTHRPPTPNARPGASPHLPGTAPPNHWPAADRIGRTSETVCTSSGACAHDDTLLSRRPSRSRGPREA